MRKILTTLATGAAVAVLALGPTVTAGAAPAHHTSSNHYTLSVTGNGGRATIVWAAISPKSAKPLSGLHHGVAHEPWTKKVTAHAGLYEIVATQKQGTRIGCTIRDNHGKLLSTSTAYGKHGVVTCIVSTAGLTGPVGGMGGTGSSPKPVS